MVKELGREGEISVYLDTEVRLARTGHNYGLVDWVLKKGELYTITRHGQIQGGPYDAQGELRPILNRMKRPKFLPFDLHVEFDQDSKDEAAQIAKAVRKLAEELGVVQFVEIELKESESK